MESLLLRLLPNKTHLGPRRTSSSSSSASPPLPLKPKPIMKTLVYYTHHHHHHHHHQYCPSILMKLHSPFALLMMMKMISSPAAAAAAAEASEIDSAKINLESLLLSIDDFFNRNPFFVASLAFIWLVVIPLTQEYLSKCKFIPAIDAFRKLRDDPNSQLLDIRDDRSLAYLPSPNLQILNKKAVQVSFVEDGEEDDFVNKVLERFEDPPNTTLCILDNFDGNSLRVAELLFKAGSFKEAYAIKAGLRGKDGWQAIQETLLPPSTHVFPNKIVKRSRKLKELKEETDDQNGQTRSTEEMENGYIGQPRSSTQHSHSSDRPLSPYPNYPDLRPPSSPTPSKPKD